METNSKMVLLFHKNYTCDILTIQLIKQDILNNIYFNILSNSLIESNNKTLHGFTLHFLHLRVYSP